jgi:hypothetical protein
MDDPERGSENRLLVVVGGSDPDLASALNCRYDRSLARFFMWNQMPSLVLMILGTALAGAITTVWWPLVVLVLGAVLLGARG